MHCCSALKMPFQSVMKVLHPVSGATGRFAGAETSSTFTHSQLECTGGFKRRLLLFGRFARRLPGNQMDLSGSQSYNMAFSSECVDGLHLSSLPTACRNPNGYAAGSRFLCIQCHSLKKSFAVPSSGDTSLARVPLSKCEDREGQQFLSTNCSFSAARASSRELCKPPLLEYDSHVSFNHGTSFSAQSHMRHHSVRLRGTPLWKRRSLRSREISWAVALSSGKLTFASTSPTRKLQVRAIRTRPLVCSYRWATTPIACAPPSEQRGRPCYKARLHGAQVTGVLAAANSPASILFLAALRAKRILHTYLSVSTSLQCSRPPCATRAFSACRQTRYISSAGNSSASSSSRSPPHPKKKHPTSFCPYELPDNLCWNWWDLYIRGLNPDYLPRQRMFAYLSSHGVCVKDMDIHEIEEFTKYLEMRRVYGEKFPVFPYSITFEDKLEDLRQKYPLEPAKAKKAKKPMDDSVC